MQKITPIRLAEATGKTRPAMLLLMCAVTISAAFGGEEPQAQAKQGRNQDPLFLTATNGTNNFLAVINTRTRQTDFVPTGGFGGQAATREA